MTLGAVDWGRHGPGTLTVAAEWLDCPLNPGPTTGVQVEMVAGLLGLTKVGWIFSQSTQERDFICGTEEICQMAAMQVRSRLGARGCKAARGGYDRWLVLTSRGSGLIEACMLARAAAAADWRCHAVCRPIISCHIKSCVGRQDGQRRGWVTACCREGLPRVRRPTCQLARPLVTMDKRHTHLRTFQIGRMGSCGAGGDRGAVRDGGGVVGHQQQRRQRAGAL